MMDDFKDLLALPGTGQEKARLKERLETLSVRESRILAAALLRRPPDSAAEAVDHLQDLDRYTVCFPAGNYEQLGRFYAEWEAKLPDAAFPYVNMERLGQMYEDIHPGLFIGNCYVIYPSQPAGFHDQENSPLLWGCSWSVKLKLASPAIPEGVWLRLPLHDGNMIETSSDVELVVDALMVNSLEDCTLLEARCILPEAGSLMEQYDSITELIRDGDELGYVLDERGQGKSPWLEKFAAALEYEGCQTLRFALDISRNLNCYDWVPSSDLAISAEGLLLDAGVPEYIIHSGCIDLSGYKAHLLESAGYMQASGETGYLIRNEREFIREFTVPAEETPVQGGMTMQ